MRSKLAWGVAVGLTIGVFANPLMPPAFYILGFGALWWILVNNGRRRQ